MCSNNVSRSARYRPLWATTRRLLTMLDLYRSKTGSDTFSSIDDSTMRLSWVLLPLCGLLMAVTHGRPYDCIDGGVHEMFADLAVSYDVFVTAKIRGRGVQVSWCDVGPVLRTSGIMSA